MSKVTKVSVFLTLVIVIAFGAYFRFPRGESRPTKEAWIALSEIAKVLEYFKRDCGTYPQLGDGLNALMQKPDYCSSWNGPYILSDSALVDPWGGRYFYQKRDEQYYIGSFGKDRKAGGEGKNADIELKLSGSNK